MYGDWIPLKFNPLNFFQLTVKSVFGRNGANALQPVEMEQKQEIGR